MSKNCLRGEVAERGVRLGGGKNALVVGGIDAPGGQTRKLYTDGVVVVFVDSSRRLTPEARVSTVPTILESSAHIVCGKFSGGPAGFFAGGWAGWLRVDDDEGRKTAGPYLSRLRLPYCDCWLRAGLRYCPELPLLRGTLALE